MTEKREGNLPMTRRKMAAAAAMSVMAPLTGQSTAKPDAELELARESFARSRESLAKVVVPMAAEPSFKFVA